MQCNASRRLRPVIIFSSIDFALADAKRSSFSSCNSSWQVTSYWWLISDISDSEKCLPFPVLSGRIAPALFFSEILPFQWGHIVCVCKNGIMDKVINPEAKTETSIITSTFWSQVWRLARPIWLHTVEVLQVFVCVTVESLRAVGALPMSSILLLDHVVVVVVVIDMQWFRLAIGLIAIHFVDTKCAGARMGIQYRESLLLSFCLIPLLFFFGLFCLLMVHIPKTPFCSLSPPLPPPYNLQYVSLRDSPFCMALVDQLGVDIW